MTHAKNFIADRRGQLPSERQRIYGRVQPLIRPSFIERVFGGQR